MQRKRIKAYITYFAIILCIASVLFIPARIKQGIDGEVRTIKIPLGIKMAEFISRDYHYRRLAKEIVSNSKTDKEKVLAIFNWVIQNINTDFPRRGNWHIIDDHILNIIIRRYGTADQVADVFATLCVYAGIPAFWDKIKPEEYEEDRSIILSFVKLDGAWKIFDIYDRIYFKNEYGEIANLKEILQEEGIVTNKGEKLKDCKIDYLDYLSNLKPVEMETVLRAQRQTPIGRIVYEIKRLIKSREYLHLILYG